MRVPYTNRAPQLGDVGYTPLLPITLLYDTKVSQEVALLDTGASLNVLHYGVGLSSGLVWENQTLPLQLTGNLNAVAAKAVLLNVVIGTYSATRLAFAWAQTDFVPLLLGQMNFAEFDVCFFRDQQVFEVVPKALP